MLSKKDNSTGCLVYESKHPIFTTTQKRQFAHIFGCLQKWMTQQILLSVCWPVRLLPYYGIPLYGKFLLANLSIVHSNKKLIIKETK